MPALTVNDLRHAAARRLAAARIDAPLLDANVLLGAALGLDPSRVPLSGDAHVPPRVATQFEAMVRRRLAREPVAYITGAKGFMGLVFHVSPAVLAPRPETELVVETARRVVAQLGAPRLIDLGTGCGAIAIAIARSHLQIAVTGSDLSAGALQVAARNAKTLGVARRVRLVRADGTRGLCLAGAVLTANLPYIPTAVIDSLQPEIARWEPRLALDGGSDGLDAFRRLFLHLRDQPPSACVLEIGAHQRTAVCGLAAGAGWRCASVHRDLAGRPRVLELRLERAD